MLLTSIAFGLAAVTLARRRVLVQELPAVEGLARVDVVCLDKTGTLTEGIVEFERIELLASDVDDDGRRRGARRAQQRRRRQRDPGRDRRRVPARRRSWTRDGLVPFSSARKWSAASYGEHGAWVLGAPEMVWLDARRPGARAGRRARGARATGCCSSRAADALDRRGRCRPASRPVALVLLEEKVRPDAAETLAYFHEQGVDAAR